MVDHVPSPKVWKSVRMPSDTFGVVQTTLVGYDLKLGKEKEEERDRCRNLPVARLCEMVEKVAGEERKAILSKS